MLNRKNNYFNEDCLRDFWDNIQHNTCIIWMSEGEEGEKGPKNVFEEIIAVNFPNLGTETDIQDQEAQRVLSKMNP